MRDGVGPLFLAALGSDPESIEILLKHGAELELPNVFGITPFMSAAGVRASGDPAPSPESDRQSRSVDLLLGAGANINTQLGLRNRTSTIMAYVAGRDLEGKSALMVVAENGSEGMVKHLLGSGADMNLRDRDGRTALDLALAPIPDKITNEQARKRLTEGRAAVVKVLRAAGAKTGTDGTAAVAIQ
jgi:hypothetical protein